GEPRTTGNAGSTSSCRPRSPPAAIRPSTTLERALPDTDAESAEVLELLNGKYELGVRHFVLDFGHPQSTEPVLRFVEQVMAPMRADRR
ncbi:MAG: hypothetical protein ACR2QO_28755, partial [Acidimicrobiales bacterium]